MVPDNIVVICSWKKVVKWADKRIEKTKKTVKKTNIMIKNKNMDKLLSISTGCEQAIVFGTICLISKKCMFRSNAL
jgi:hypothetical protein